MTIKQPSVYIIGGPNGAGKTTAALSIMPEIINCYEYVNADTIASALSPFRPQEVAIGAGRLMLQRIRELAAAKEDFAFETTMASRSFVPFLQECRKAGYQTHCVYIWLQSPELSVSRVALRVRNGGHFVPENDIRRRYVNGLNNFFKLYIPVADSWSLYDNSESVIKMIAQKLYNSLLVIQNQVTWDLISGSFV